MRRLRPDSPRRCRRTARSRVGKRRRAVGGRLKRRSGPACFVVAPPHSRRHSELSPGWTSRVPQARLFVRPPAGSTGAAPLSGSLRAPPARMTGQDAITREYRRPSAASCRRTGARRLRHRMCEVGAARACPTESPVEKSARCGCPAARADIHAQRFACLRSPPRPLVCGPADGCGLRSLSRARRSTETVAPLPARSSAAIERLESAARSR